MFKLKPIGLIYPFDTHYTCGSNKNGPPMTGNGNHTTYENGDDWGMVYEIVLATFNGLSSYPLWQSRSEPARSSRNLRAFFNGIRRNLAWPQVSLGFLPFKYFISIFVDFIESRHFFCYTQKPGEFEEWWNSNDDCKCILYIWENDSGLTFWPIVTSLESGKCMG